MKIIAAFDCRPEPRSTWDETATGDATPWRTLLFVPVIRKAILAAVATGDQNKIDATLEGALAFCEELKADYLSLVPSHTDISLVSLALLETHHEGPANEAEISLVQNPCPTEAERAIGPLSRQCASLVSLIERCRREARQPQSLELKRASFITPRSTALFKAAR
jgi:hypothetical protein